MVTKKSTRGRGRPKKVTKEQEITKEDIQKALGEIADQKLKEAGVKPTQGKTLSVEESVKVSENIDKAIMEFFTESLSSDVPFEWQPIMNVLTRMYEASEEDYQNVKYNKEKNSITINLDGSRYALNKELANIKTQLCCDTLSYNGVYDTTNKRVFIVVRKK